MQPSTDYYRVLGLPPGALPAAVKQAYRAMALRHHPDRQPDNPFAAAHFTQIYEAYSVLSDARLRARYDEDRWLAGFSAKRRPAAVTAPWLAQQANLLRRHIASIDTYRMDSRRLSNYLEQLLSDAHYSLLLAPDAAPQKATLVADVLVCVESLPPVLFATITARLEILAAGDTSLQAMIRDAALSYNRSRQWTKAKPWILVTAALVLCVLMVWYSRA